jgi:hypothetical protein
MPKMDATTIQTIAAIIQALAALVFLGTVVYDARSRKTDRQRQAALVEQHRRDNLISALARLWRQTNTFNISFTDEELSGFFSQRQIDFINDQLKSRGESWRYPFDRVS